MLPDGYPFAFHNAPVCKALLFVTGTASTWSILFTFLRPQSLESKAVTHLIDSKIFSAVTQFLCYSSVKNLLFGSLLLYKFRIFEHRYGSKKFADFIMRSTIIGAGLHFALSYGRYVAIEDFPYGPLWVIFSFYIPFFFSIPSANATTVLGVFPLSGKFFTYMFGIQLVTSKGNVVSGLIATIAGAVSYFNIMYVQNWLKFPTFLTDIFSTFLGGNAPAPSETDMMRPQGATEEIQRQIRMDELDQEMWTSQFNSTRSQPIRNVFSHNANTNRARQQPTTEVSEQQIQRLIEMGFTRYAVLQALTVSNNNIPMAMNILLSE